MTLQENETFEDCLKALRSSWAGKKRESGKLQFHTADSNKPLAHVLYQDGRSRCHRDKLHTTSQLRIAVAVHENETF